MDTNGEDIADGTIVRLRDLPTDRKLRLAVLSTCASPLFRQVHRVWCLVPYIPSNIEADPYYTVDGQRFFGDAHVIVNPTSPTDPGMWHAIGAVDPSTYDKWLFMAECAGIAIGTLEVVGVYRPSSNCDG